MFGLSRTTYDRLRSLAWPALIVCLIALFMVWCPGIGHRANGSNRWIGWGFAKIQPSEFAKLGLILYLAAIVSQPKYPITGLWRGLTIPLIAISVVCLTVEREPDLGTSIVLFMTALSILWVAGAQRKHVWAVFTIAVVAAAIFTATAEHRRERIWAWLEPEKHATGGGFQILQSLIAVSESGPLGRGFGNGEGRHYIPASGTDYIMATVAEETGLPGIVVIVGVMAFMVWQAYRLAARSRDRFASLVGAGVGSMLMWQILLNLAVVTNSVPSTGVPMPFISAGGSSLIACLAALGILCRPSGTQAPRERESQPLSPHSSALSPHRSHRSASGSRRRDVAPASRRQPRRTVTT
ncbi:MAG: cell division protein FtsW [Armatimonadetes bacterium]|nr:cell division protein FtsW [Armatimonadota bacterium]